MPPSRFECIELHDTCFEDHRMTSYLANLRAYRDQKFGDGDGTGDGTGDGAGGRGGGGPSESSESSDGSMASTGAGGE